VAADEKDHLEERIYGFVDLVEMEMVVVVVDEDGGHGDGVRSLADDPINIGGACGFTSR